MFDRIFDLPRRPFAATPDPACFFDGEAFQAALDELVVCVERGQGIGILTGDPGLGKTLLCQCLIQELTDRFRPVFLSNSNIADCRSLLQTILCELGQDYSGKDEHELRLDLRQWIQRLPPSQPALVLIVDEAHHFATEVLEEIRLLADIADAGRSLVRVILSGQMSLEERLTERAFDALNQRICAHVTLLPMTLSESRDYLEFRMQWAGGKTESLISYLAVQLIARASAGVPRCLNQLADHCLLLAVARDERPVGPETVREALAELKQLPLQWNDLHELSSFSTVGNDTEIEANDSVAESSPFVAPQEPDESQWSMPAAESTSATATSVTAAETCAFEFGGDPCDGDSIELESSVEAPVSQSQSDATVFEVVAAEPVPANIEASFDPLSTNGVCITISSPRRSRAAQANSGSVETPAASATAAAKTLSRDRQGVDVSDCQSALPDGRGSKTSQALRPLSAEPLEEVSGTIYFATTHKDLPVPKFVEEIVVDHYAALQEPEFSGIIWTLARQSQSTDNTEDADSHEPAALAQAVESAGVTIEFGPSSSFSVEPVFAQPVAQSVASNAATVSQKRDDVHEEDPLSDDFISDIRPLQPTRFLDAIIPLLGEVLGQEDDDNDYEANAQRMSRAEGEVEGALIDELATGELDLEDEIAAEVLDLRLDTQAAIRKSRLLDFRSLERDLESVPGHASDDDFAAELPDYDVVQPPDAPTSKRAANVAPPASHGRDFPEGQAAQESPAETTRRPLGRLFTELRRRQRSAG